MAIALRESREALSRASGTISTCPKPSGRAGASPPMIRCCRFKGAGKQGKPWRRTLHLGPSNGLVRSFVMTVMTLSQALHPT